MQRLGVSIVKPSKIRKMKRDMAKAHNVKRSEVARITKAQEVAWDSRKFPKLLTFTWQEILKELA